MPDRHVLRAGSIYISGFDACIMYFTVESKTEKNPGGN